MAKQHRLIMVTARDLAYDKNGKVVVGPDTIRVCKAAIRKYRKVLGSKIIVTAGYSKRFDVVMGPGPMREYLVRACGIPASDVYALAAKECVTNGEMAELTRFMREVLHKSPDDCFDIYIAASWWHLPRAWALFEVRIEPWQRRQTTVRLIPAFSLPPSLMDRDWWKAFVGELLLVGFLINIRNGNLFWWRHDLHYCSVCKTHDCCEIRKHDNYCHRCHVSRPIKFTAT